MEGEEEKPQPGGKSISALSEVGGETTNWIDSIRGKIDPEGTLPNITLNVAPENVPSKGTLLNTMYDVSHDGAVIGRLTIGTDSIDHIAWLNGIRIDEQHRGKGFGLATYVSVIERTLEEGNTLRTHDWSQTASAKHIWEILEEKGVASVIEPFVPDGTGKFNGKYEVKQ